jgi:hypothetical protein
MLQCGNNYRLSGLSDLSGVLAGTVVAFCTERTSAPWGNHD